MGREIRKVPPSHKHPHVPSRYARPEPWNHPEIPRGHDYIPAYEQTYEKAMEEYNSGLKSFVPNDEYQYYHECKGNPPKKEQYVSYNPDSKECTWFQVYETVSEGTPVTPPFATKEDLANYLAINGDFWDQFRRQNKISDMSSAPWGIEAANKFVFGSGWAPSLVFTQRTIKRGTDL
jgi:hypothetical protein